MGADLFHPSREKKHATDGSNPGVHAPNESRGEAQQLSGGKFTSRRHASGVASLVFFSLSFLQLELSRGDGFNPAPPETGSLCPGSLTIRYQIKKTRFHSGCASLPGSANPPRSEQMPTSKLTVWTDYAMPKGKADNVLTKVPCVMRGRQGGRAYFCTTPRPTFCPTALCFLLPPH